MGRVGGEEQGRDGESLEWVEWEFLKQTGRGAGTQFSAHVCGPPSGVDKQGSPRDHADVRVTGPSGPQGEEHGVGHSSGQEDKTIHTWKLIAKA